MRINSLSVNIITVRSFFKYWFIYLPTNKPFLDLAFWKSEKSSDGLNRRNKSTPELAKCKYCISLILAYNTHVKKAYVSIKLGLKSYIFTEEFSIYFKLFWKQYSYFVLWKQSSGYTVPCNFPHPGLPTLETPPLPLSQPLYFVFCPKRGGKQTGGGGWGVGVALVLALYSTFPTFHISFYGVNQ